MRLIALVGLTAAVLLGACKIAPNPPRRRPGGVLGFGADARLALERYRMVDLTHAFDARTVYWPVADTSAGGRGGRPGRAGAGRGGAASPPRRFRLDTLARGETPGGWFYAAEAFAAPEHGGTHLDAPYHFDRRGDGAAAVPLERLIAPAVVIDIARQAASDPDYAASAADVEAWEKAHGEVRPGDVVLLRTGWSTRWPDARYYLGGDSASDLHFPSFGADAIALLVRRGVAAVGVDVASTDIGASKDFQVHRILAEAGVPALENLTNLAALPASGFLIVALPMKIAGGSGAPVRAVALVPDRGT